MKKSLKAVTAAALLAATVGAMGAGQVSAKTTIVSSDMPVKVLYNARQISGDVDLKVVDGAVLVPIRFISEKIGAKITLEGKEVTISNGKTVVQVTIGSRTAVVGGKSKALNAKVISENGRTLVPLQAVAGLGIAVEWDSMTRYVWVGHKNVPELKDEEPKPTALKPYLNYYKNDGWMLNLTEPATNTTTIIDQTSFPFKIGNRVFYRFDLSFNDRNETYIKATTTDKGIMVTPLYFLTTDGRLLFRDALDKLRVSNGDFRTHFYPIISERDKYLLNNANYKKFSLKQVSYIQLFATYDSFIFLKNPWR
ncbi:copper amine oxidase N-terminal domain-containing protein [Paenibacillus methanolicus]|uniref:Copper amine oxidase-like protein n=1 Tax=Paenibacillus methanolicus TaxID=582686 RepID=A0A5S5BU09_9BACL|nr:copper amine oxidase N-terminal domain-containing protein [Paenibacillus methanolicus]TYP69828.1 copper amine oxidase-like protein [Paenibacillus methanolicus]